MRNKFALFLLLLPSLCLGVAFASEEMITGAGSTFIYPVLAQWTKDYDHVAHLRINYQGVGSSAGINQLEQATLDFAATDKPLHQKDLLQKQWLQFPVVVGGIVPIVNIKGIKSNQLTLDGPTLADIYLGKITFWDDQRVKQLNPALKLPHTRIITVHRADGSGTTFNFTHYLSEVNPVWKARVGFGTLVRWPSRGLGAKQNGGVAGQVQLVNNSIGYVEYTYAEQENLVMVSLRNREQQTVTANLASFASAAQHAMWRKDQGYHLILTNQPGANSWPIVAASFVLLPKNNPHSAQLLKFFTWCIDHQGFVAKKLGYVVVPPKIIHDMRVA